MRAQRQRVAAYELFTPAIDRTAPLGQIFMQHANGGMVFFQNFYVRWMFVYRDNVREAFRCQAWNKILADQTSRSGYYNFSFSYLCHISVYANLRNVQANRCAQTR